MNANIIIFPICKVVPVHAMKAERGSSCISRLILHNIPTTFLCALLLTYSQEAE